MWSGDGTLVLFAWHWCYLSTSLHPRAFYQPSKIIMAVKVLALDATAEEQRQIKSELEILHKVLLSSSPPLLPPFLFLSDLHISSLLSLPPLFPPLPEPHRDTPDCVCYAHPYQLVFHSHSPLSLSPLLSDSYFLLSHPPTCRTLTPLSPSPPNLSDSRVSPMQCNSRYIIGFYGAIFHENRYVFLSLLPSQALREEGSKLFLPRFCESLEETLFHLMDYLHFKNLSLLSSSTLLQNINVHRVYGR